MQIFFLANSSTPNWVSRKYFHKVISVQIFFFRIFFYYLPSFLLVMETGYHRWLFRQVNGVYLLAFHFFVHTLKNQWGWKTWRKNMQLGRDGPFLALSSLGNRMEAKDSAATRSGESLTHCYQLSAQVFASIGASWQKFISIPMGRSSWHAQAQSRPSHAMAVSRCSDLMDFQVISGILL